MRTLILIALGSNVGDSVATLQTAVGELGEIIQVERVSTFVRSAPMYITDQPPFVNAVIAGHTDLGPFALLAFLKDLETKMGRQVRERNGPRELDLDLIAYGALRLRSGELEIPHPRIAERRFVLQPLAEIAPNFSLPGLSPVSEMLAATEDQALSVQPISDAAL